MTLFPTSQWLDEYQGALNESGSLTDIGADWGVGFDGSVCIAITDLPVDEQTIGDLPRCVTEGVPADVCADVADVPLSEAPELFSGRAREALPETAQYLIEQLETNVHDGNVYVYLELERGKCTEVDILEGPNERAVGTTVAASCDTWQQIVEGRPVVSTLLNGDLKLDSSGWQGLTYPLVLQALGDVAADVESTHIFDEPDTSFSERVMDASVRQPVTFQKMASRQVALASKVFSVF